MYLSDLIKNGMELADAAELLVNVTWTMLGAFLVYFMQAGFAMVETGFTRAKNAGNIIMKNMMDFVLGPLWAVQGSFLPCSWRTGMGILTDCPLAYS